MSDHHDNWHTDEELMMNGLKIEQLEAEIERLRAAIWMALDNEDSIAVAEVRRVLNQRDAKP